MSDNPGMRCYPNTKGAPRQAFYVLTELDDQLVNGKVLEPGPGIAITVVGDQVIVENTGGGGGGSTLSTYITKDDETSNLPNSFRLVAGPGVSITYGTNTVTFSAVAGTQSFLTAVAEASLTGSRQVLVVPPLDITDAGAGAGFTISIIPGSDFQVLGVASGVVSFLHGTELGTASHTGGGIVNLTDESEGVHLFDCTDGSYTVNLPPAGGCVNKTYLFKKMDSSLNTVTIVGDSGETIDDEVNIILTLRREAYHIRSISTQWILF